mgnify:CR=1 FL=1
MYGAVPLCVLHSEHTKRVPFSSFAKLYETKSGIFLPTFLDIYYYLTKALGVDVKPNFGPERAGDIKHSNADISKAKELLGYDPDWSFAKGIEQAIAWYKENL